MSQYPGGRSGKSPNAPPPNSNKLPKCVCACVCVGSCISHCYILQDSEKFSAVVADVIGEMETRKENIECQSICTAASNKNTSRIHVGGALFTLPPNPYDVGAIGVYVA